MGMASTNEGNPVRTEVWIARLREFVHECVDSGACDEADRIREAALLLQAGLVSGAVSHAVDPVLVDAMLSCGAAESAVIAMMDRETAFMLSRGQNNACLATVIVGENADEMISEGATLGLALLSAYVASVLSGLEMSHGASRPSFPQDTSRLH